MTADHAAPPMQRANLRPLGRRPFPDAGPADAPPVVLPPTATNTSGFHVAVPQRHHVEAHPLESASPSSPSPRSASSTATSDEPALRAPAVLHAEERPRPTMANVYGVLSLIVWLLVLVVAVKYIVFIMRADNRGEGGIPRAHGAHPPAGAAAQRTPRGDSSWSRSACSAPRCCTATASSPRPCRALGRRRSQVVTPAFTELVVPLAMIILFGLFFVQRLGTGRVGTAFGPVMALWFVTIAVLGANEIVREPRILWR